MSNFPSNPSTGATFNVLGKGWIYDGYGWAALDDIIGISAGNQIAITITGQAPAGPTYTIDVIDGATSDLHAGVVYGVSGSIYASSLATGLLHGGIITINAGNSAAFDITSGSGQIHSSGSTYTADPQPTYQYVTWPAQTGITLQYLSSSDTTWIYIDSSGTVQQRSSYYTDNQLEENIIIGQLVHPSRTFINLARTNPNVAYATDKQYEQFIRIFGPVKGSGHTIQPNGANLKLNRTSGTAFSLGRNWINDTNNPSVVSDGAYTDCIFYRYYRGATAGTFITVPNQTAIDPTNYDDGSGTLQSLPGGKYSIQRIFYYPNTPTLLGVYYGRAQYTSLADAAANINFENFTEIENTKTNAIFVAYLLVKSGATDLTNTSDALILQAGSFRSTTSGGGSVSLTLDDLTDVIITSPQNYQVLTYVDGVTGWENLSVTSLPLVSSFNGLTGAVTGVTTGTANTFGPLQSFTNGISSAGGTFSALTRFTAGISASGGMTLAGGTFNLDANIDLKRPSNSTTTIQAYYSPAPGFYTATSFISLSPLNGLTLGGGTVNVPGYLNVDIRSLSTTDGIVPLKVIGGNTPVPQFVNMTDWINGSGTILSSILVGGGFSGPASNFSGLLTANGGISSAGGTFSSLTRFTAGISASGGMTLANTLTIQNNTAFGITASSPILQIMGSPPNSGYNAKRFSYFSSSSTVSNTPICSINTNGSGRLKITIANVEQSTSDIGYNISTFIVSNLGLTVNWTENLLFNGSSRPSYNMSYSSPNLTIFATQSTPKLGALIYRIEIEQI